MASPEAIQIAKRVAAERGYPMGADAAMQATAAILRLLRKDLTASGIDQRLPLFRERALQIRPHAEHIDAEQTKKRLNEMAETYIRNPADSARVRQIIAEAVTPIVNTEIKAKPQAPVLKAKTSPARPAHAPGAATNGVDDRPPDPTPKPRAETIDKTPSTAWRRNLIVSKDGTSKGNVANAITAFRLAPEWQGVLAYDEFALVTKVTHSPPWEGAGPVQRDWSALDDVLATNWLQHNGISVGLNVTEMAVEAVAQDAGFHPVKDYLNGLKWDGKTRVGPWLTSYFGVERSPYADAVGERFLISAVARVMQPGCKADAMLIIEGPQGIGKSRAIHALAGKWFSDELAEIGTKDASLQLRGAWIFELSELNAMQRSENEKIKSFLSRKTDRFRPPYGRRVIEAPRQCVLVGTTNGDSYLKDETGARRQWPVRATKISPEAIERDRDQLWAEAVQLYRAGRRWWIDDPALASAATEEQDDRYSGDPWDDLIARYVDVRTEVSVAEILRDVINIPINDWSQLNQNRVVRSLKSRKWVRFQKRTGERREWLYRRG